ncbi:MAG: GNAT family N-acetyltransferase [Dehalococcoidia bacterium]|nr:GNAT family N-acetyltransferase [Dehalococcoidia bacterium]
MSGVVVRLAEDADGPAVFAAWQVLRGHYASVDHRFLPAPVSVEEFVAAYRERFGTGRGAVFVAVDDDRLTGLISCTIEESPPDRAPGRHVTIGHLFVEPEYRLEGIGKRLFETLTRWAQEQDSVSHFEMPVLAADAAAAQFWKSLGFTPFIERLWAPLGVPETDS